MNLSGSHISSRKAFLAQEDSRVVTVLDVGSSKVACFTGRIDGDGSIHLLGMGHRISQGVKNGAVVDLELAETSIKSAVEQAEKMAGERVDQVLVSLSAGQPQSQIIEMDVSVGGHEVTKSDISRVLREAGERIDVGAREIVHAYPACFAIDGAMGVKEPIGMYGNKLSVAMHVLSNMPGPMRNLETVVDGAHLGITRMVLSPYASGYATLVEDEMALGTACIDMGGGTTGVSVWVQGAMVYSDVIPMGGQQITEAIARELLTPIEHAERLKTLYGSATSSHSDESDMVDVPQLGGEADMTSDNRVPRSTLTSIIYPHVKTLMGEVNKRLEASGFDRVSGRRVVLTGGASQLQGLEDVTSRLLGKQVRLGRPRGVDAMPVAGTGPAFATCAGLLKYAASAPQELGEVRLNAAKASIEGKLFHRATEWLRRNF